MPESLPSPPRAQPSIDVQHEVMTIVGRVMGKARPVTPESELLGDLGFDSLRVLELVGDLEDHFSIAVPLNALTHIKTVGQIAGEVERLVDAREHGR